MCAGGGTYMHACALVGALVHTYIEGERDLCIESFTPISQWLGSLVRVYSPNPLADRGEAPARILKLGTWGNTHSTILPARPQPG